MIGFSPAGRCEGIPDISRQKGKKTVSIPAALATIAGHWSGLNRLWLSPAEPALESDFSLDAAPAMQGQFIALRYTWSFRDELQEGLLIVGCEPPGDALKAVWFDSWHLRHQVMLCEGAAAGPGAISVLGHYAVPPGPDWGWRIVLKPHDGGTLLFSMHNIPPGGAEELAVEVLCHRCH